MGIWTIIKYKNKKEMLKYRKSIDNETSDKDITPNGHVCTFISYQRLAEVLKATGNVRKGEEIKGYSIEENGIRIIFK